MPTHPIWLLHLFSLLHHDTYTTQTVRKSITNFVAVQTLTKGHRLTTLQTTYGSISTSFITAQTVVSCVRASSGFHLMTGTNFQHDANDICNCFYSFSTVSLVSGVAVSFVALSGTVCKKRVQNKTASSIYLICLFGLKSVFTVMKYARGGQ